MIDTSKPMEVANLRGDVYPVLEHIHVEGEDAIYVKSQWPNGAFFSHRFDSNGYAGGGPLVLRNVEPPKPKLDLTKPLQVRRTDQEGKLFKVLGVVDTQLGTHPLAVVIRVGTDTGATVWWFRANGTGYARILENTPEPASRFHPVDPTKSMEVVRGTEIWPVSYHSTLPNGRLLVRIPDNDGTALIFRLDGSCVCLGEMETRLRNRHEA